MGRPPVLRCHRMWPQLSASESAARAPGCSRGQFDRPPSASDATFQRRVTPLWAMRTVSRAYLLLVAECSTLSDMTTGTGGHGPVW